MAVEPKTKVDQEKMGKALQTLSEEDPTFQVRTDEDTGQTVISGMGELHLEVIVDRMLREFRVDATVGKPQVAYRETITQTVDKVTYTHKKQTGGSGQFAEVTIKMEPLGPAAATSSSTRSPAGVPRSTSRGRRRHPAVARRRRARRLPHGRHPGHPLDGKYHDVDSSEMAFKIAGSMVFKGRPARPSPSCSSRSCRSRSSRPRTTWATSSATSTAPRPGRWHGPAGNSQVRAQVPLSEMFGYATDLRSRPGSLTYTMQFHSYQQTPASVQEEIVARVRGE